MGANLEPIGRGNNDGTICSKDGGIAVDCFGHEGNAEFLSHAQADVLWLVDEVRSLRAALATAERERDQLAEIDAFVRERLGDPRLADVPLKLLLEGVLVQRAGLLEQCATLTQERDAWNEAAADLTERLYQEGVKLAASESRARALREALIHRCASARIDPECEDCQQIIALIDQDGPGAAPSGEA